MYQPPAVTMMGRNEAVRRIVLPDGIGVVEIEMRSPTAEGAPRVLVAVRSDSDRYGPAADGRTYTVTNGDPGVVHLTAESETP